MNRIVLIGNGFDLAHGLKTSYKDFIDDYWEGFIKSAVSTLNSKVYNNDDATLRTNYTSLRGFKDIVERDKPASYNDILKLSSQVKEDHNLSLQISIENKFLKNITEKSFINWVDIEDEYYKFLCNGLNGKLLLEYRYENINLLNTDFYSIRTALKSYLINLLDKTKPAKSEYIGKLIYSNYSVDELSELGTKELIINEANKIKLYSATLNTEHISIKTLDFPHLLSNNIEELLSIKAYDREFWNQYFELTPDDIMFLNFNFTNLEKLYIDTQKPVNNKFIPMDIHIHGELNNPNNSIIFGYGDEIEENYSKLENLQDNDYLENIKSIQYLETDNYKKMLNFINSDRYQVIILGHSCGNSDRTLLNTLFEHENCVSIKPYYYQYKDEKTEEIKDNYSDIVRNISRSFKDKKSMRDKVVNKMYTDWFSSDGKE